MTRSIRMTIITMKIRSKMSTVCIKIETKRDIDDSEASNEITLVMLVL